MPFDVKTCNFFRLGSHIVRYFIVIIKLKNVTNDQRLHFINEIYRK